MQHLTQFANTSAISGLLSTIMTNKRSWSSKLTNQEQNMKKIYISRSCDSICSCGIMVCMYECKLFLMGFLHPKLGLRFFSRCGYVKKQGQNLSLSQGEKHRTINLSMWASHCTLYVYI